MRSGDVHVHLHLGELDILDKILEQLVLLNSKEGTVMAALETITTEVSEAVTVMQGAKTLIERLAQEIRDNIGNPEALTALASDLDSSANSLSEAVVANTPAEEPPVEPVPEG